MKYTTYRKTQGFIGLAIGAIVGATIALNNWWIPLITILIGVVVSVILRKQVTEKVTDERTYAAAGNASRMTLTICTIGMAVIGLILFVLDGGKNGALGQSGLTLLFTTCALLIVNALAYTYYNFKLGGKNE